MIRYGREVTEKAIAARVAKQFAASVARFWSFVQKGDPEVCWEWTGHKDQHGYGRLSWYGRPARHASRVSYELAYPEWDRKLHVLHTCDNPGCINPAHLFLGTQTDNNADKVAKGRQGAKRKLTADQVVAIRSSSLGYRELAEVYGVKGSTIHKIRRRELWKWV